MIELYSLLYRTTRFILGNTLGKANYEPVVLLGHKGLKLFKKWAPFAFKFPIPDGLSTSLHHLSFPSPLILSSFEGDDDMIRIWTDFGLGGAILKTITPEIRLGNPQPRMLKVNTPEGEGLINAMGLPGKGWSYFLTHLNSYRHLDSKKPIGISLGGHSPEEYLIGFKEVSTAISTHPLWKRPYFFEINISCPNTPEGTSLLKHPDLLETLLKNMRNHNQNVIIGVKLSPDQSNEDLKQFAKIIAQFPLTYLALGNTQYRKNTGISIGGGGLSGPSLYPRCLEMVRLLAPYNIPIIAIGGIQTTTQVKELQKAGATLCAMATGLIQDPYRIPLILRKLSQPQ